MNTFKKLIITGSEDELAVLLTRMRDRSVDGWAWSEATDYSGYVLSHRTPLGGKAAKLCLARLSGGEGLVQYAVTNIVPDSPGHISREEYNSSLEAFLAGFVRPSLDGLQVGVQVDHDDVGLRTWLGEECAARLESFSAGANRLLPHPCDTERWNAFIIRAHQDRADLPQDIFERWLVDEEHWPEEEATRLVIEYQQGRALLQQYDRAGPGDT